MNGVCEFCAFAEGKRGLYTVMDDERSDFYINANIQQLIKHPQSE